MISKKYIKYAYVRNYLKRIIREKFRLYQHQLIFRDFIIIIKKKITCYKKKNLDKILEDLWFFSYPFLLD